MEVLVQFGLPAEARADWLLLPVWEDDRLDAVAAALDGRLGGALGRLKQRGDLTGKANELIPVLGATGIAAERLLLVGLGKREGADKTRLVDAAAAAARHVTGKQRGSVAFVLPPNYPGLDGQELAAAVVVGLSQGSYGPGIRKSEPIRFMPESFVLVAPPSIAEVDIREGGRRGEIEAEAVRLTRELVNLPPCELYPETFAAQASEAANSAGVVCEVFDEKRIEAERMGALLAVARGSERPPRVVVLRYQHGGGDRTLGLVGKGVTFDSGGLSLKPSEHMIDMKCDMAGAATVLAAVQAIARLQVPVNILGVLALVENLPSGKSMKLGDVLRTRSGKTIEVLNTDAEGRLILADALSYAVDQKVDHLVDLATLTGACVVALGTEVAGLMGNNDAWCEQVLQAARRAGERAWQLPMYSLYDEMIKSSIADMKNTGGSRYGGAITAAKLLQQFVGEVPWAHLDIAGPAWAERESATRDAGGTGCFVRTLVELARAYGQ
ncbi:MAG TPA: leucyl aminopeptidase [Gemmataceae bacterium]|nr:leucyl aminopeptidase [Gemmataceae bacterium]